jgi:hypothetical protein
MGNDRTGATDVGDCFLSVKRMINSLLLAELCLFSRFLVAFVNHCVQHVVVKQVDYLLWLYFQSSRQWLNFSSYLSRGVRLPAIYILERLCSLLLMHFLTPAMATRAARGHSVDTADT